MEQTQRSSKPDITLPSGKFRKKWETNSLRCIALKKVIKPVLKLWDPSEPQLQNRENMEQWWTCSSSWPTRNYPQVPLIAFLHDMQSLTLLEARNSAMCFLKTKFQHIIRPFYFSPLMLTTQLTNYSHFHFWILIQQYNLSYNISMSFDQKSRCTLTSCSVCIQVYYKVKFIFSTATLICYFL